MRSQLTLLTAAALLLGACSYDFQNPVEKLDSGEVTGRVLADQSGTGELTVLSGVTVELKNSGNVQSTRTNGRFFMTGLLPGRHTLLFSQGSTWALQRDIDLPWGSDGQPESVVLGDLRLRRTVNMGGTLFAPIDGYQPAPPTAFVFDEATGARASATPEIDVFGNHTGRFTYSFAAAPVGPHRLRFAVAAYLAGVSSTFVGGPLTQDLPDSSEGQSLTLTQPNLHERVLTATGRLHFRVRIPIGAPLPTVVVSATSGGATLAGVPAPDSVGVFDWDVDEGIYFVRIDLGAAAATLQAPAEVQVVIVADQTTDLGTLYVVDPMVVSHADNACLAPADCGVGLDCVGGQCVMPACFAGDFSAECLMAWSTCTASSAPTPCNGGAGWCGELPGSCVPKGVSRCDLAGQPVWPICVTPY